jgi:hypothetical protein
MNGRGPTRHMFVEDVPPDTDPITGVQYCGRCHLPSGNAIHNLPARSEEQRAAEARRMGDRG